MEQISTGITSKAGLEEHNVTEAGRELRRAREAGKMLKDFGDGKHTTKTRTRKDQVYSSSE